MCSELKYATQIYVNPIHFEIQLILGNYLFSHTRTWWPKSMKSKNCPKFFHRVIFALWIPICNPDLCKSHTFWNTANIEKWSFFAYPDLITKIDEIGKLPKILAKFKSATQIYVNPIHFEIQLILRNDLFFWPKSMKSENCPKFLHRVIFALWIQICNPNLCKSHIFWITANIEKWSFFAYPDLLTKIGEIGKIAWNSIIG